MNKTYCFSIPCDDGSRFQSDDFTSIEDCVEACKAKCEELGVDYNDREVKLYLTDDFGETYEECTEEGELAG